MPVGWAGVDELEVGRPVCREHLRDFLGKEVELKKSGKEVCCTNAVLLLTKITLCSKLHCQRVLLLSYEIEVAVSGWGLGFRL